MRETIRGHHSPYDLNMPGLRQRWFSLLGSGPALANLPDIGRSFSVVSLHHLLSIERKDSAGYGKMSIDEIAMGDCLGSSSGYRLMPAGKADLTICSS